MNDQRKVAGNSAGYKLDAVVKLMRANCDETNVKETIVVNSVGWGSKQPNRNVHTSVEAADFGISRFHADRDIRIGAQKIRKARDQQFAGKQWLNRQSHGRTACPLAVSLDDSVKIVECRSKIVQQSPAGIREAHRARQTFEQRDAEGLFELLDLVTDGGSSQVKFTGRKAKALVLCGGAKCAQCTHRHVSIPRCHADALHRLCQS